MLEKYEHDLPILTVNELETLIDMFQTELKIRKDEREEIMRQYQEELDRLLDAIEGDGFYVNMPDCPSPRVVIMDSEDD